MRNFLLTAACLAASIASAADRPNILWLTCEDMGPHLRCYGDAYATSPHIDRLASRGLRYRRAWSCAPVCAPARTTLISGLYPPSTGSEHMRSLVKLPPGLRMFPQDLREAGYYCTNNVKEDYNLEKSAGVWDESSNKAHWKNRSGGQPFFAVFNHTITHESQIRTRPHKAVHDPAKVRIPAYHPDTPEVRQDWAQYYDNITTMDLQVGQRLKELEDAGLADETIVFFFSDHGSGMPRNKRFPGNSGLHVPLIVVIPEKFRSLAPADYAANAVSERLVSFVDFAPTVLSLAGIKPPEKLQGRAFLGGPRGYPIAAPAQFVFGFRARMDERYDLARSVCDGRYVYIRNYMPHRPWGQHVSYMFETPTTRVWHDRHHQGKLSPEQSRFWQPKEPEELYDLQADPDEVRNLCESPEHAAALHRLRDAHRKWAAQIRDVSLLPEDEMHRRAQGSTPYEMGHDVFRYPFGRIFATAEAAASLDPALAPKLREALKDPDAAVRYWAALGLLIRGKGAVKSALPELRGALDDPAPSVRIAAAEALGRYPGEPVDRGKAIQVLLRLSPIAGNGPYVPVLALNSLGEIDGAGDMLSHLKGAEEGDDAIPQRVRGYVPRLLKALRESIPVP